jgi:hypothetical protein
MALPDWLFENFLFRPLPGRWFAGNHWHGLVTGLLIALALGSSALWMLEERLRRLGHPISKRTIRGVCIAVTSLAFLGYFDFFNPNTRYEPYYHRHEFYHYYLGAKYFSEIGYGRLYTCTAIAEVERGRGAELRHKSLRNLDGNNLIIPITESYVFSDPDQCKRHFSDARWQAFKTDIDWFERVSRGTYWDAMHTDHGYNPPPVWTMTGKLFAGLAPAGDHFFKLLAGLDVLLQFGALLLFGWAFGLRVMTVAAVFWGCNGAANFHWTGGAFLRQDWFFLLVAALCLARKRHFAASGAALTWSALLRVFPIVVFAGVGVILAWELWYTRRLRSDHRRFLAGSALAGLVLVTASSAVCGVDAYPQFVRHIRLHEHTPLTNNMGLEMLLTHDWRGRMAFNVDDRLDDPVQPWKDGYAVRAQAWRPAQLTATLLVFAWLGWVLRRTRLLWVGMALSLPLLMSVLNLTCYDYAFFVAPAALTLLSPALAPAYLALAGGSQILLHAFYWIDDTYAAESLLFYAFSLSMLYALSRPLIRRRSGARS